MIKPLLCLTIISLLALPSGAAETPDPYRNNPGQRMQEYEKEIKKLIDAGAKPSDAIKWLQEREALKPKTYAEHKQTEDIINTAGKNLIKLIEPPGPLSRIHVRRAFPGDDYQKSALFSFSHTPDADVYAVDAAVVFDVYSHSFRGWTVEYQLSSDLKLSSDEKKTPNRVKNRVTAALYRNKALAVPAMRLTDILLFPSLVHETDKDFDTQNLLGEFLVQPAFDFGVLKFNLQTNIFVGGKNIGRYELGPVLGAETGAVVRNADKASPEHGSFFRPLMRARFQFVPNILEQKLSLYVTETVRFLSDDDYDGYNLFTAGGEYEITKHVTATVSYEVGKDAPKFQKAEQLKVGLGVKF